MPKPIYMLILVSTMPALCACGITGNYRKDPGYAVFSSPGFRDTDRPLALSLGRLPIGLASRLAPMFIDDEPEIVELLRSIRGIRVYIYEIGGDAERVSARLDETQSKLLDDGWDSIVAVRDDGG